MENYDIPCVIVHRGFKPYLKYNLEITSKNNKVFLIGDESVSNLDSISDNIEFINIEEYETRKRIVDLKKNFVNYNTQPQDIEWMNFERVFIIHNFILEKNYKQIFHLDSDNVLLKNINDFKFDTTNAYCIPSFQENYRMDSSIHCGLLDEEFFFEYEKLYNDLYITKNKFHLIEKKINYHKQNNIRGGITDMTLYFLLQKLEKINPQNLMKPFKSKDGEEFVFINNFNLAEGFYDFNNFEKRRKKIKLYNGNSVNDLINLKKIKIANIHFQGTSKKHLNRFSKYRLKY
tara:strand:- start:793 stop:1659 length:867 start_codon:yes stop_codon:yes gene_type:complete